MLIAGFPAGPWGTNCYVVATGPGSECVVVDPGKDAADGVAEVVREHRLKPVAVLVSHGHIDHMWCVAPVAGTYDATAYIHPRDRHLLADPMAGDVAGDRRHAARRQVRVRRARRRRRARRPADPRAGRAELHRRPHPGPHRGVGDLPDAVRRAGRRVRGDVLRRPALRRLHRPHRPARRRPSDDAAQPARQGAAAAPTTSWCCPATASRPASAASAPPTRSCSTCCATPAPAAQPRPEVSRT